MEDSVSVVDMEAISPSPNKEQDYLIRTSYGSISVTVYGEQHKPALITYPDLALNLLLKKRHGGLPWQFLPSYFLYCMVEPSAIWHCELADYGGISAIRYGPQSDIDETGVLKSSGSWDVSCFQGLLFCPEIYSLLLHNFCIYHISPPGHELGAAVIDLDDPILSADDLADQIAEVLNFFRLGAVMCLGVTAGAYILTLFSMKHRERVLGLILVSPLCKAPSWTEWLYNKVMSNLLYFYGMCGVVKEILLKRYFSKEVRGSAHFPESDIAQACQRSLDERQSLNVWRFLEAINGRSDIRDGLRNLHCRSLIFVGDLSPFHSEALHMTSKLDSRLSALVEVQACGSMVTEEQPHAMLIPMENFLMVYGFYRQSKISVSPRSPLTPSWISPELFTPESMGLKLKPIKTRMSIEV